METAAFLGRSQADIVDELEQSGGDLSLADLAALTDAEAAGKSRKGVLAALDKLFAAHDEAIAGAGQGGKADRGEQPDWQKQDYSGPLTATQALWRGRHIVIK
jgi:hypothetical protein